MRSRADDVTRRAGFCPRWRRHVGVRAADRGASRGASACGSPGDLAPPRPHRLLLLRFLGAVQGAGADLWQPRGSGQGHPVRVGADAGQGAGVPGGFLGGRRTARRGEDRVRGSGRRRPTDAEVQGALANSTPVLPGGGRPAKHRCRSEGRSVSTDY